MPRIAAFGEVMMRLQVMAMKRWSRAAGWSTLFQEAGLM